MKTNKFFFLAFILMMFVFGFSFCNKDDDNHELKLTFQKNISGNEIPIGESLLITVSSNKTCTITVNIDNVLFDKSENVVEKGFALPTYQSGEHLLEVIGDDGVSTTSSQWVYVVKTKQ